MLSHSIIFVFVWLVLGNLRSISPLVPALAPVCLFAVGVLVATRWLVVNTSTLGILLWLLISGSLSSFKSGRTPGDVLPSFVYLLANLTYIAVVAGSKLNGEIISKNIDGKARNAFVYIMLAATIAGFAQTVSRDNAIFLEDIVGGEAIIKGYNTTNNVGAFDIYLRANGILFYEPSVFAQFLTFAIAIVITFWRKPWFPVIILCFGIASTFSGVGILSMVLLAIGVYVKSVTPRQFTLSLLSSLCLGLMLYQTIESVSPGYLLMRTQEISTDNTSASMRFYEPYRVAIEVCSESLWSFLFGKGPGAVSEISAPLLVLADFSSLPKLVIEYGLPSTVAIISIVTRYLVKVGMPLALLLPLLGSVFVFNNGLYTPLITTFVLFSGLFAVKMDRAIYRITK